MQPLSLHGLVFSCCFEKKLPIFDQRGKHSINLAKKIVLSREATNLSHTIMHTAFHKRLAQTIIGIDLSLILD